MNNVVPPGTDMTVRAGMCASPAVNWRNASRWATIAAPTANARRTSSPVRIRTYLESANLDVSKQSTQNPV